MRWWTKRPTGVRAGMLLAFLLVAPSLAHAEAGANHEKTTAPAESRFEIVQSTIAARTTVKLDKWTGNTYIVVQDSAGAVSWQLMDRAPNPADVNSSLSRVNYQLFTSSIAGRFTYLLNVNNGATWLLVEDTTTNQLWWTPM